MNKFTDINKLDEEFNNFMIKVNEVGSIVQKLASDDKKLQEIGDLEAKTYLGDDKEKILEDIGEKEVILKVKSNKTIVNRKAFEDSQKDGATMSQEAFMAEVSKDADKRYKDRLIKTERMETFKKQATLAFKRGDYAKALTLYDKAIGQIKDSPLLYNNRALTYIHLKLFDKAKEDLNWALRLNEDCLKSWLLLAKVHFIENRKSEFEHCLKKATERNPEYKTFIDEYIGNMTNKV